MAHWYHAPNAKCPYCEQIFQMKISKKRLLWLMPVILLIMIIQTDLITKHLFSNYLTTGIIVTGALGGLIAGIGIRLCYVAKKD